MPTTDPPPPHHPSPDSDPDSGGAAATSPTGSRTSTRSSAGSASRAAGWVASALFLLLALPIILTGFNEGRASRDARFYHEPVIREFAPQLPAPDLTDYASATTPLYHLVLALPVRMGLDSTTALRLLSAAISVPLFYLLASSLARRWPSPRATLMGVALTLPLIASNYSLFPGVFVLPDNLAWLMVLVLLLRAQAGCLSLASCAVSGVLLALLVATRQIHLWVAGPLVVAAFLSGDPQVIKPLWQGLRERLGPTLVMTLWVIPAVLIVAYFYVLWNGLTPPRFQVTTQSFSPSLPAFVLLEIAILSLFFSPWLWPVWKSLSRATRWKLVLVGGAVGLALAAGPETTWSFADGRASGWWNLVRKLPVIGGHSSIVVLLGAPAGAICLGVWGAGVSRRDRVILGVSLLAFAAAQTASANVWQRYHEPMLLMLMAIAATGVSARLQHPSPLGDRARLAAPLALALLLALITAKALVEGDRDPNKQAPDVFGVTPGALATPENTPPGPTETNPGAARSQVPQPSIETDP